MNNDALRKIFYNQLRGELGYEKSPFALHDPQKEYYDKKYEDRLREQQIKDKVYKYFKLEYHHYKGGRTKICSLGSSARLFYLNKRHLLKDNFRFEFTDYHFIGGNGEDNKAHFDGNMGNIFYEAKCQEILKSKHSGLRSKFYNNLLKNEFGIKTQFKIISVKVNGEVVFQIEPTQKQFDICSKDDESIYNLRFDVKQLITHLLALGKRANQENEVILQYVVFRPADDKEGNLEKYIYDCLRNEFKSIRESSVFGSYISRHKIIMPDIQFVSISDVKDIIAPH